MTVSALCIKGLSREMLDTQKPHSTRQNTVLVHFFCCLQVEKHHLAQQHQSVLICLMGDVEREVAEKKGNYKLQFGRCGVAQQSDKGKHLKLGGRARTVRLCKLVGDKGTDMLE